MLNTKKNSDFFPVCLSRLRVEEGLQSRHGVQAQDWRVWCLCPGLVLSSSHLGEQCPSGLGCHEDGEHTRVRGCTYIQRPVLRCSATPKRDSQGVTGRTQALRARSCHDSGMVPCVGARGSSCASLLHSCPRAQVQDSRAPTQNGSVHQFWMQQEAGNQRGSRSI